MAERIILNSLSGLSDVPGSLNPFPVEYPHQLLLSARSNTCGATLITAFVALTSAHCVSRVHPSEIIIFTANNRRKQKASTNNQLVKKLVIHEKFNEDTHASDLAILVFETPFSGPSFPMIPDKSTVFQGEPISMRWTESETIVDNIPEYFPHPLNAFILPSNHCQRKREDFTSNRLCVKPAEDRICFDDLSNQLLCSTSVDAMNIIYLCGIFSWSEDCGKDRPAIFTKVGAYQTWIFANIRKNRWEIVFKSPIDDGAQKFIPKCSSEEFLCNNTGTKQCKSLTYICDGDNDCPDGWDEENCRSENGCHPLQFPCRIGNKCIPRTEICNGKVECSDASDEENCPYLESVRCNLTQFYCRLSRQCISEDFICDGANNCGISDTTDEENCKDEKGCHPTQFACRLGNKCIPEHKKCDGNNDCPDSSDEDYCHTEIEQHSSCNNDSSRFYCNGTKKCISNSQVCNGRLDCGGSDKSDEIGCRDVDGCHRTQFACRKGNKCIAGNRKCNGKYNCLDGSDERDCPYQSSGNCSSKEFLCSNSKKCIPRSMLCDGYVNCGERDTSDEQNCRDNNGCHPTQFSCRKGSECIDGSKKCDGNSDCNDKSDEADCLINSKYCGSNKFFCNVNAYQGECYEFSDICDGVNDCEGMRVSTDEANCAPGVSGCAWNQFACRDSRKCVQSSKKCNAEIDCDDGSDEENCHLPNACHWTQFHCQKDRQCYLNDAKCDGEEDCSDGSDEKNCEEKNTTCLTNEFECREDRSCIRGHLKCDGKKDCRDGSDEEDCQLKTNHCSPQELPCNKTRKCYGMLDICNGKNACGKTDSTDEENCIRGVNGCLWTEFPCHAESNCIPGSHKCDEKEDCADGSDEENCHDGSGCHWTQFVCHSDRKCIPGERKCDGSTDCEDYSDENNCLGVCHWAEFQCPGDGNCIPGRFKCDGKLDCKDGSDEADCKSINSAAMSKTKLFIYVAIPSCIIILLIIALVIVLRKYLKQSNRLSEMEIKLFEKGDEKLLQTDKFAHENAQFLPYNRDYEIKWKDFELNEDSKLGEGAYGVVFRGTWTGNSQDAVAIKTVKPKVEKTILLALLSELKVMIHLGKHENIVELLGACTEYLRDGRVYMLVEFCPMGSLEGYLREMEKRPFVEASSDSSPECVNSDAVELVIDANDSLCLKDLLLWSIQIARGMQHLQCKNVIHGDLATRNLLLFSKHHVKITDFGLSRQLLNYDNYVKKTQAKLPWRWLALETLKSFIFSHKSDVWAYGITLWEIFSMAQIPYPGMGWTADFVTYLENNNRLSQPKYATEEIYNIMSTCWTSEPESRPDFTELEHKLRKILFKEAALGY